MGEKLLSTVSPKENRQETKTKSNKPFHFHLETQTSNLNDLLIGGKFANSVQILSHL
jgi:hypothetical protein